ncbi:VOC family protein [Aquabacterium sp. J223]|uniref:VOC family protein n=1 Tax=Aquabacterium sp. J223 TaxID=2898431 RepID=UPI0021ADA020|nr:VOC family protein [Aquabacterium sp. J223]UUX94421.1 VOC family protein [Aquabacterium sp. J223]
MLQQYPMFNYLPARDLARARRFYETVVGLTPDEEVNGGVVYRCAGGTAAFLYPTPNAGTSKASQAFWSVDDLDAVMVALAARGVVFDLYPDLPGERSPQGALVARRRQGRLVPRQ